MIGTASSEEKRALAMSLGAKTCVHYDQLEATVRDEVGDQGGVEVVFDGVGKNTFESSLSVLRPRGLLVRIRVSLVFLIDFTTHNPRDSAYNRYHSETQVGLSPL